jgi:hypothetical protein
MGKPSTENRAVRSEQKPAARHGQKRGIKDRRANHFIPAVRGITCRAKRIDNEQSVPETGIGQVKRGTGGGAPYMSRKLLSRDS